MSGFAASVAAIALGSIALVAAPSRMPQAPTDLVLDCYVVQYGNASAGQFVRHLHVHPERGVVSISDSVRGRGPRFIGDGHLVTLDSERLVYEFGSTASSGQTTVDRRSGTFLYRDGRNVISGSCREGGL